MPPPQNHKSIYFYLVPHNKSTRYSKSVDYIFVTWDMKLFRALQWQLCIPYLHIRVVNYFYILNVLVG